jgi:hypothetical protein
MANVRKEIEEMMALGPLPSETDADIDLLKKYESLYRVVTRPVTDDEARVLVNLFGTDGCFGMASSLMHLIETAPGWPLEECLRNQDCCAPRSHRIAAQIGVARFR